MAQALDGAVSGATARFPEIPGFQILGRPGEGGMGEVLLARQLSLDRNVAIKLVRPDLLTEEWFLERLEREARVLARLRNPHLMTVHDFVRLPDGAAAIVMEWVEGGCLRDQLRDAPSGLPLDQVLKVSRQVALALSAAHSNGVIHRDIKPENVLLDAAGQVRVSDFGMALASGATRMTGAGAVTGTPGYLAPEQLSGGEIGPRTDLFAFGVLLYEMLTGRLPMGSFDPPNRRRPETPASLEAMVLRTLKPDPSDRPKDLQECLEALSETSQPVRSVAPTDRPRFFASASGRTRRPCAWLRSRSRLVPSPSHRPGFRRAGVGGGTGGEIDARPLESGELALRREGGGPIG